MSEASNMELATDIIQIGLVVEDAEATARRYQELLGISGWQVNEVDTRISKGSNFLHRGKSKAAKAKVVWTNIGKVEIELIEPLDEESVYAEFLADKGPGIHHVMFSSADFDESTKKLREAGVEELASGELKDTRFALFDTAATLGLICEFADGEALEPDYSL